AKLKTRCWPSPSRPPTCFGPAISSLSEVCAPRHGGIRLSTLSRRRYTRSCTGWRHRPQRQPPISGGLSFAALPTAIQRRSCPRATSIYPPQRASRLQTTDGTWLDGHVFDRIARVIEKHLEVRSSERQRDCVDIGMERDALRGFHVAVDDDAHG